MIKAKIGFKERLHNLKVGQANLLGQNNSKTFSEGNGIYCRFKNPFARAESPNGVDNFIFWDYPVLLPETENPDTNVYDMRLVQHENSWINDIDGRVLIYYASSDTRLHLAESTINQLLDYCMNTPEYGFRSSTSVKNICSLIEKKQKPWIN